MLVMKDNERLYPATWVYNSSRLLTQLAKIVTDNGGTVKPLRTAIISNRVQDAAIREYRDKIAQYTALEQENHNPKRAEAIRAYTAKLEKLTAVNNEPIAVTHTTYITFVLNGIYYYFQTDDNPFFPFYIQKTPVKNGKYSKDACMIEDRKEWMYDCFFECTCTDADIIEGANLIYNMLVNAQCTRIIRDGRRQRVPNTYNGGYHYETVYAPERIGVIDF